MTFNDLSISESAIETTGVQSQPDTLTGTAAENKLVFDALPQLIVARFNMLITQLQAQAAAEQLGVTPFTGMTATNLQDALEALQTNLTQAIAGVGTGLAGSSGAASVGFNSTEQITAATVQAAIEVVQQHLDAFKTQMTGSGGAASVGTAPISGLDATNVQAALAELRDDIQNIVSGIIPGGTITTNMLADGSVTAAKLNVTGEDIPTSTTDATSLSSQLSNAVMINGNVMRNGITGATLGGGCASIVGTADGAYLEWYESFDTYEQARSQLRLNPAADYGPSAILTQTTDNGIHWDSAAIATARPSQEYNLPLAPGITQVRPCTYRKNQFDEVLVCGRISGTIIGGEAFATLPEGFRPSHLVERPAVYSVSGSWVAGTVVVLADGTISRYGQNSVTDVVFAASFVADG